MAGFPWGSRPPGPRLSLVGSRSTQTCIVYRDCTTKRRHHAGVCISASWRQQIVRCQNRFSNHHGQRPCQKPNPDLLPRKPVTKKLKREGRWTRRTVTLEPACAGSSPPTSTACPASLPPGRSTGDKAGQTETGAVAPGHRAAGPGYGLATAVFAFPRLRPEEAGFPPSKPVSGKRFPARTGIAPQRMAGPGIPPRAANRHVSPPAAQPFPSRFTKPSILVRTVRTCSHMS